MIASVILALSFLTRLRVVCWVRKSMTSFISAIDRSENGPSAEITKERFILKETLSCVYFCYCLQISLLQ